ncbi:MAG: hypothetical protein GY856_02460 [bacterium]|nr:hypothetical protein [bacterium]
MTAPQTPDRFPATRLEDAYSAFDRLNEARLRTEQLPQIYQERSGYDTLRALQKGLRLTVERRETHLHGLYMGPAGCGKSTDLAWLGAEIEKESRLADELLILHYSIGDAVGTYDIGFAEVALSMVLRVYETLEEKDITFERSSYLEKINQWLFSEEVSKEKKVTGKSIETGGSLLRVLKGALYGRIVRESDVKMRVQRLLPELRKLVEELFREVRKLTGRELFFIVDDLEKLSPLDTALGLFLNHGGFFGGLPCHLIFTAPGSLTLDSRYQSDVLRHFREIRALLANPTDEQGATAEMDALRRLVYRRMAPALAEEAAVDEAIVKTGGLLSHLIDVLHQSILLAIVDEEPRVGILHVRKALKEISLRFFSVLTEEDYLVLDRLEGSGLRSHMERPELLHNLSVLEYPNDPSLFALHPLVGPLLERWRQARIRVSPAEPG